MDLARVAARLRSRTPYEAIDLGFVLARHFWKPLALGWLVCALPLVGAAILIAALTPMFWLPLLAVWWLKPLYDRPALFVLSRAFFGDVPSLGRTIEYTLQSWRSGSALADLTWRRFSPFRGIALPVRHLEQLGGADARSRLRLLLRRQVQIPTMWLLGVSIGAELILFGGAVALLAMVVPQTAEFDLGHQFQMLFETSHNAPITEAVAIGLYFGAMSVVELFYVAASFGLYINRRVSLEGWDVEIVFRKLAARLRASRSAAFGGAAALLLAVSVGLAFAPAPAVAQEPSVETESAEADISIEVEALTEPTDDRPDPQATIEELLEAPEFGSSKTETRWEVKDDLFENEEREPPEFMEGLTASIATIVEVLLWIVAAAAVIAALVYFMRFKRRTETSASDDEPAPVAITEVEPDVQPTQITLPADLVDAAIERWEAGAHAESMSILYRGTIRGLAHGYRIEIDPSCTARECVDKVESAGGPADYVAELAAAWTATVYADRRPTDERARELFATWRHHFRAGGAR